MFKTFFFSSEWHFYTWKNKTKQTKIIKTTTKNIIELFLYMLLKFEMIWLKIRQDYEMIPIFMKHSVYLMLLTLIHS